MTKEQITGSTVMSIILVGLIIAVFIHEPTTIEDQVVYAIELLESTAERIPQPVYETIRGQIINCYLDDDTDGLKDITRMLTQIKLEPAMMANLILVKHQYMEVP